MSAQDNGRDVATNIAKTPESEQHNSIVNAVADAYGDFESPTEFNYFLKGMTEGFGNNTALLNDLQIVNSQGFTDSDSASKNANDRSATNADNANKLNALYALDDTNGLFEVLDTYHQTQDDSDILRSDWNPFKDDNDGNIGLTDLERFLEDAKGDDGGTAAKKFLEDFTPEQQEKIQSTIQTLIDSDLDDGITEGTIEEVGEKLGFGNPEADDQRRDFETYYGAGENSVSQDQGSETLEEFDQGGRYSFTDEQGNTNEVGIHRDQTGKIDEFRTKNGDVEEQFKLTDQGWMRYDSNGQNPQPWNGMAPDFKLQDGKPTFAWYERDPNRPDDPNAIVKRGFESNGNPINMELSLDPNAPDNKGKNPDGTPVAIEGLNRTPTGPVESQTNIGDLPVTFKPGYEKLDGDTPDAASQTAENSHAENTIKTGTNLTEIARQLLKGRPGENDQQAINKIIDQLVDFNKIDDPNLIYADAQLKIPVDLQY